MTTPLREQSKSEDGDDTGTGTQNKAPAQKWSEERRIDDFLKQASAQERTKLEQSHQVLQALIQDAKNARKAKSDGEADATFKAKVKDGWNSASEKAYRYSQRLDPMLAHAPAYASLAYGGIKIILVAQINYQELKEKVELHLEQIAARFEIIDHLTAYIPTKNLIDKVATAYGLFTKLLDKAVKYYTRSRLKSYLKSLSNPWDRFQALVDDVDVFLS